jgi:outer membrane protein assembly factor BamE (lipoprotein component of BamABCDE complex)
LSKLTTGWAAVSGAVLALAALVGCDAQKAARLQVGVSTEADVRREFGEPAAVFPEADGTRTFEYPRQPEGQENWFVTLGPDGKLRELRQVLTPSTFAAVAPGMDKAQVRRLLGLPAKVQTFELKREEVWDWRYADAGEAKMFSATFDADGRVRTTAVGNDPRYEHGGPSGR